MASTNEALSDDEMPALRCEDCNKVVDKHTIMTDYMSGGPIRLCEGCAFREAIKNGCSSCRTLQSSTWVMRGESVTCGLCTDFFAPCDGCMTCGRDTGATGWVLSHHCVKCIDCVGTVPPTNSIVDYMGDDVDLLHAQPEPEPEPIVIAAAAAAEVAAAAAEDADFAAAVEALGEAPAQASVTLRRSHG